MYSLEVGTLCRRGVGHCCVININAKSLTVSLRSLEENRLINRKVFATVPVTVEYSLYQ